MITSDYIEDEKIQNQNDGKRIESLEERLGNFTKTFNAFLEARKLEQENAENERRKWRLAIFAPIIVMLAGEIMRWLFYR